MIQTLKKAAFNNRYLFIAAALLYTVSFLVSRYWYYASSPKKTKHALEMHLQKQEARFFSIADDTIVLNAIFKDGPAREKLSLEKEKMGLFGYEVNDRGNPIQIYWNSYTMAVNPADIEVKDGIYTAHYQNGFFELLRHSFVKNGRTYILIGLIPIRWDYFFENKYLQKEFDGFPDVEDLYEISSKPTHIAIKNSAGKVVYYLQRKTGASVEEPNGLSLLMRVAALLFLVAFVNELAVGLVKTEGFLKGFLFLLGVIVVCRFLTYQLAPLLQFRKLELFDPAVYASNNLHPSLGDLLVNAVLVFWVIVFFKTYNRTILDKSVNLPPQRLRPMALACLFLLTFITFELTGIVRSLVIDSKIPFDVTNFFNLNVYTFISFILLSFLLVAYYHLTHLLVIPAIKAGISFYWRLVMVAISGLVLLTFSIGVGDASIEMKGLILVWILLYLSILELRKNDIRLPMLHSAFFLFWVMFFSFSVTVLITVQNKSVELEQRKKIAEKLALQTDPSGENLLNVAITNFTNDFLFNNFNRFRTEYSNKFIKDSLINENFSGYLNKYDTHIYVFDSSYTPLYNDDTIPYHVIKQIIASQGKATDTPDLYYYESASDLFSYLYEKEIKRNDSTVIGHLFVIAKPKRYKSDALYPELFKQVKDIESDLNTNYAYAVYSKSKLINNFNDYPFPSVLSPSLLPRNEYDVRNKHFDKDDYSELWYNAGNNKVVLIAKKSELYKEMITFFAYLFCIFLSVVMLFHLARFLVQARFRWEGIKELFKFSIRTQIHTTIIFISIFSFVVIAITTISFFYVRFDRNNEERLTKAIQVMGAELESITNKLIYDDGVSFNELGAPGGELERKIIEISELHNVDVNMYNASGELTVSTQPYIYNKHILSEKMEPRAFYALYYDKQIQWLQKEQVGKFSYWSMYVPVKDQGGNLYAYLNIPYLNSQKELNQEISNFLVTLIDLNVFIFVLAGAIALLVTNRITASFTLIGEKMRQISLRKTNEEIVWNRHDEIGVLVNEYNKMVHQLEESAQGLARSEREGAWREMARQVAHEIKNPLTPMKLSIQYLQRAIDSNAPNVKQLSQQVANTLVEQIDQLSKIAGDFSQFANIGNVKLERFDLIELIDSLVNLYQADSALTIYWNKPAAEDYIYADKTQINRLFTNLIKNAIEASEEKDKIVVIIQQYREDQQVTIAITDKGTGIAQDMQQKIFTPNFTTKSSGTGLGLAICKGIVEKANGHIWFETQEEVGSTFFVSLPLDTADRG